MRTVRACFAAAGVVLAMVGTAEAQPAPRVLRVVPQADVTVLDPMFGTAWVSLVATTMTFESLFTWDSALQPRPMMAESWDVSPDGLTWRFRLREGLRFHSGEPVTVADVIASARRWMGLDPVGARVGALTETLREVDARTLEFRLRKPFGSMLFALAAAPARFLAVMRAKDIEAGGTAQISTSIGSGPFRFVPEERVAGHRTVWARNPDYQPRAEPPDGLSGARVVKVDRVEWHVIPDAATAAAALVAGEVDMLERPVLDQVEMLARQKNIRTVQLTPLMAQNLLRPNASIPPFNDPRMRRALAYVIDQPDEMAAGWGEAKYWRTCNSYFVCGGPFGTEAGAENFHQDFAKARLLAAEAGYKGEKLTFVSTHEIAQIGQMAEVAQDALKRAGFNVEMVWVDWGTVGQQLRKRDSWHLFLTGAPGALMMHPLTNIVTEMTCEGRNFVGWACDTTAETLREAFFEADDAARPAALDRYHRRLAEMQPYRVLGQYTAVTALRANVSGLLPSPVIAYWNIEKR